MNTFLPALSALLPGIDDAHLWQVNGQLELAEQALTSAIREATEARDALRAAREATTREQAGDTLGRAFSLAMSAGASGTLASNVEKACAGLVEARAHVQVLDRFRPEA